MPHQPLDTKDESKVQEYLRYQLPSSYREEREKFSNVGREKYKFDHHFQALKYNIVEELNNELKVIKKQTEGGKQFTIQQLIEQRKEIEQQVNKVVKRSKEGMEKIEDVFFFLLDRSNYFIKKLLLEIEQYKKEDSKNREKIDEVTEKVKALLNFEAFGTLDSSILEQIDSTNKGAQEEDPEYGGGATKTDRTKKHRN